MLCSQYHFGFVFFICAVVFNDCATAPPRLSVVLLRLGFENRKLNFGLYQIIIISLYVYLYTYSVSVVVNTDFTASPEKHFCKY